MAKRTSYRVYDLPRLAMAKRGNAITHSMIRPEYRRATKHNPHRIYDPPRSNTRQRSNTNTGPTFRATCRARQGPTSTRYTIHPAQTLLSGATRIRSQHPAPHTAHNRARFPQDICFAPLKHPSAEHLAHRLDNESRSETGLQELNVVFMFRV